VPATPFVLEVPRTALVPVAELASPPALEQQPEAPLPEQAPDAPASPASHVSMLRALPFLQALRGAQDDATILAASFALLKVMEQPGTGYESLVQELRRLAALGDAESVLGMIHALLMGLAERKALAPEQADLIIATFEQRIVELLPVLSGVEGEEESAAGEGDGGSLEPSAEPSAETESCEPSAQPLADESSTGEPPIDPSMPPEI
jgi:hypothetical protein